MIELDDKVFIDNSVIDKFVASRFGSDTLVVPGVERTVVDFKDAVGQVLDIQTKEDGLKYCHVKWENVALPAMWLRKSILQRV